MPSFFSIFSSIIFALFIHFIIYPFVLTMLSVPEFYNIFEFFYIVHAIVFSDPLILEGIYMARPTEVETELRNKRADSQILRYKCRTTFDKFLKESNNIEKNKLFKNLMRHLGDRIAVAKDIDSISGKKSHSQSVHSEDYAIYVAKYIVSLGKKK